MIVVMIAMIVVRMLLIVVMIGMVLLLQMVMVKMMMMMMVVVRLALGAWAWRGRCNERRPLQAAAIDLGHIAAPFHPLLVLLENVLQRERENERVKAGGLQDADTCCGFTEHQVLRGTRSENRWVKPSVQRKWKAVQLEEMTRSRIFSTSTDEYGKSGGLSQCARRNCTFFQCMTWLWLEQTGHLACQSSTQW